LREYGHMFSPHIWAVIYRGVLFPIMDSAKLDNTVLPQSSWPTQHPPASKDPLSWIATTAAAVLSVYSSLFHQYYFTLTGDLLPDLLSVIEGVIDQGTESLSLIGLNALRGVILNIPVDPVMNLLSPDVASRLCHSLCTISARQLVLNFEDAGVLELDSRVPQAVKEMIVSQQTKLRANRGSITSEESKRSALVKTPFGLGKVLYTVDAPPPFPASLIITGLLRPGYHNTLHCTRMGSNALHE
jgi:hypothetical protein